MASERRKIEFPQEPPPLRRIRKIGELYEDPETGWVWQVYAPPYGDIVMQTQFLDDLDVEQALEIDNELREEVFYTHEHPEGLILRNGEWRSIEDPQDSIS